MRRLTATLLATGLIAPGVVLAPTVSLSSLASAVGVGPRPVDPVVRDVALTGVDAAAARSLGLTGVRALGDGGSTGSGSTGSGSTGSGGGARTAVLTAPMRTDGFQTVGVSWDLPSTASPDLDVRVRTHRGSGWGAWFTLDVDDVMATVQDIRTARGILPDGAAETSARGIRGGTEPYWAGRSDGVQVRIDVRTGRLPSGLKLELIDPGSSAYDALVGATPAGSAVSAPSTPTIYSRAQWGADESKVRDTPTVMPTIRAAVIHHTAGANGYTKSAVPGILRATYAYHLSRGWDDIGYNFLVDRFGRIWEGRGGGTDRPIQGAHAGGFNYLTFGVSVMGNYDGSTKPSKATLDAIARLVAWKLDLHRVDPLGTTKLTSSGGGTSRYPAGKTVKVPTVMGHRDVGYTACPGKNIYAKIGSIRSAVAGYTRAQLIGAKQSATTGAWGATGPTWTFKPMTTQHWKLTVADSCTREVVLTRSGNASRGTKVSVGWDGTIDGEAARAGLYTVRLTSSSSEGSARPFTSTYTVRPPANLPTRTAGAGATGAGRFTPVNPTRLYNSRSRGANALGPSGRVDLKVAGRAGVPTSGVTAVVLDVWASCATADTSFTVRRSGASLSLPAELSLEAGASRSTQMVSGLDADGYVSLRNLSGISDVRVDVVGYYRSAGSGLRTTPFDVVYNSRTAGSGHPVSQRLDRTMRVPVPSGLATADVTAALLQVAVLGPRTSGYVSLYGPNDSGRAAGSLAYTPGASTYGLAVTAVHNGKVKLRNHGSPVHVQVRVVGVYTATGGAAFVDRTPKVVWGGGSGATVTSTVKSIRVAGGSTGVPSGAKAVLVRLTASDAAAAATVTLGPATGAVSPAPGLRVTPGTTATGLVVVPVDASGTARLRAAGGKAKARIIVIGYYR